MRERTGDVGEDLEALEGLEGGGDAHDGTRHAALAARRHAPGRRRDREDAPVAGPAPVHLPSYQCCSRKSGRSLVMVDRKLGLPAKGTRARHRLTRQHLNSREMRGQAVTAEWRWMTAASLMR